MYPAHGGSLWVAEGLSDLRQASIPLTPGLTESLFRYNCDTLYLKDGKGAMTWKKKNQWLSANKGPYAVNVLLGSQILPFSTALAWCPGVIYSAVIWWSLHQEELNKNAIKRGQNQSAYSLFNKNSWRMGRQTYKQCTSSARGWLSAGSGFGSRGGPAVGWLSEPH